MPDRRSASHVHDGVEDLPGLELLHDVRFRGETRSYSSSFSTACMKGSVKATEMLKLFSRSFCCLQ